MPQGCSCLLIGNTRWHWASQTASGWAFAHTSPRPEQLDQVDLLGWAAVGTIPDHPCFEVSRRVQLKDVPLKGMPPWLGIDRALAAWAAFQKQSGRPEGLLVADAGTVLSLTRISADGAFSGGQLAAGFGLQLRAMATGTRDLPAMVVTQGLPDALFPEPTLDAMQQGVAQSLLGLLLNAQQQCPWPLWLCGGDAPLLINELRQRGREVILAPDLVMEGLVGVLSSTPNP